MALTMSKAVSIVPLGATLGEGPVWDVRRQCLWFVDIKQQKLHCFNPETRRLTSHDAPAQIGWALCADDGRLLCGLQDGLYWFDPDLGRFAFRCAPEPHLPGNRQNDATTDRQGRIWFGTMDNGEKDATGRFYMLDRQSPKPLGPDRIAITNGPAVSPDGRFLYFNDTLAKKMYRGELSAEGLLGKIDLFIAFRDGTGYPDGPTCDSAGNIWVGMYAGWGIRCFSPAGAEIDFVEFPVANITKMAFAGADMKQAYATTAAKGLTADERKGQPLAGDLFTFTVATPGVAVPLFRTA
jgi:xylono-1,5-lactonase